MSDYVDWKIFCVFYNIIISLCPDSAWGVNIDGRPYTIGGSWTQYCTVWSSTKGDAVSSFWCFYLIEIVSGL